jgi:hypothetical protein
MTKLISGFVVLLFLTSGALAQSDEDVLKARIDQCQKDLGCHADIARLYSDIKMFEARLSRGTMAYNLVPSAQRELRIMREEFNDEELWAMRAEGRLEHMTEAERQAFIKRKGWEKN